MQPDSQMGDAVHEPPRQAVSPRQCAWPASVEQAPLLLEQIFHHARERPDEIALRFLQKGRTSATATYAEIVRRAAGVAGAILGSAAPGERALLVYPAGLEFIYAFLGCLIAGVIAVPCYPPKRNRHGGRLHRIAEDCSPTVVLTVASLQTAVNEAFEGIGPPPRIICTETVQPSAVMPKAPTVKREAIAFLQYTSGSTQEPRGVIVTHGNIAANEAQIAKAFMHASDCVMASWLPASHDMGLLGGILQPLYVGFPSVLMSPTDFLSNPFSWLKAVSDYRGTTTGAPNFAFDLCVKRITDEQRSQLDLRSLRVLYNGSEPVRADTLDRFAAYFAPCGFRPQAFLPCYGLAEATLLVSGSRADVAPRRLILDASALEEGRVEPTAMSGDSKPQRVLVSCGPPADGIAVDVLGPEGAAPGLTDMVGEVCLSGPNISRGYWHGGAALAGQDSAPGPMARLRTGDLGFLHGGELYITGRCKDTIIINGRNLYPQDIEATVEQIVEGCPINGIAAFGFESNGTERLGIVVESPHGMGSPLASATTEHCESRSAFQAIFDAVCSRVHEEFGIAVDAIVCVRPGTFPRTTSGKVQRGACRRGFIDRTLCVVAEWRWPAPFAISVS